MTSIIISISVSSLQQVSADRKAIYPTRVALGIGIVIAQIKPSGRKSRFAVPPSSWSRLRSITSEPTPLWEGVETGGPRQCRINRPPVSVDSVVHSTRIDPASLANAPYFTALVASSLNTMPRAKADFGENGMFSPLTTMRSTRPLGIPKGSKASWTISNSPALTQFSRDRTSCRSPLANQMRLIDTTAYWLMLDIRDCVPSWHPLWQSEFAGIRLRLLKIAGRIAETASRIRVALASCCPEAELFSPVAFRLQHSGPNRRGIQPLGAQTGPLTREQSPTAGLLPPELIRTDPTGLPANRTITNRARTHKSASGFMGLAGKLR